MTHYWGIDEPLREEDLKVVHDILYPVKIKWREIGLQLKLQPAELHAILRDPSFPDEGLRLMHVLTLWLQNADPLPTWPVIIEALRSQSVNSTRIAEDVRARYCPTYPVELFLPPNPVPPVVISEILETPAPTLTPTPAPVKSTEGICEGICKKKFCGQKGSFILFLAVISLCIVFAFGGITLMTVGIRGLNDDERYTCSLGPPDAFNALNLITGIAFLSGILITILVVAFIIYKDNERLKKVITWLNIGVIAASIVFIIADVIYAFYVASHVLPNVEKWERNKTLCGNAVFRSSFGIIVTYFLMIFVIVVIGAVYLAQLVFKKIKNSKFVRGLSSTL